MKKLIINKYNKNVFITENQSELDYALKAFSVGMNQISNIIDTPNYRTYYVSPIENKTQSNSLSFVKRRLSAIG